MIKFFAITLFEELREPILRAQMGRFMGRVTAAIHPVWPEGVHDILHPHIHHLDEQRL